MKLSRLVVIMMMSLFLVCGGAFAVLAQEKETNEEIGVELKATDKTETEKSKDVTSESKEGTEKGDTKSTEETSTAVSTGDAKTGEVTKTANETKAKDVTTEITEGKEKVEAKKTEEASTGETAKGKTATAESTGDAKTGEVTKTADEAKAKDITTETTEGTEKEVKEGAKTEEKAESMEETKEETADSAEATENEAKPEEKAEEVKAEEGAAAAGVAESAEGTEKAEEKATGDKVTGEAKVEEPKPKSLDDEIKILAVGVDGIIARLGKMQDNAKNKENKKLSSDLSDLEDKIASLRKQSDMVSELNGAFVERGKAHFKAWEQELANLKSESLREKGEKRRKKQSETFKEFRDKMVKIDKTSTSFKSRLDEIADYLKYDLRPASVSEISSDINKLKRLGDDITELIGEAQKDLKSLPVFKEIE